jgi:hypothetical protein
MYYRTELPEDDKMSLDNVLIYQNKKFPYKQYKNIDDFHDQLTKKKDYSFLENRHDFIQFLFPIREKGVSDAQPLTKYETEIFSNNKEMLNRLIKSYEIMLDFYGCEFENGNPCKIKRNEDNYRERYHNLNYSGHNYLRITRILKCLGIMGLEKLKYPLIKHFIDELNKNKYLDNIKYSLYAFWVPTLRDTKDLGKIEPPKSINPVIEPHTWASKCFLETITIDLEKLLKEYQRNQSKLNLNKKSGNEKKNKNVIDKTNLKNHYIKEALDSIKYDDLNHNNKNVKEIENQSGSDQIISNNERKEEKDIFMNDDIHQNNENIDESENKNGDNQISSNNDIKAVKDTFKKDDKDSNEGVKGIKSCIIG